MTQLLSGNRAKVASSCAAAATAFVEFLAWVLEITCFELWDRNASGTLSSAKLSQGSKALTTPHIIQECILNHDKRPFMSDNYKASSSSLMTGELCLSGFAVVWPVYKGNIGVLLCYYLFRFSSKILIDRSIPGLKDFQGCLGIAEAGGLLKGYPYTLI